MTTPQLVALRAERPGFEPVPDPPSAGEPTAPAKPASEQIALNMMVLALRSLSQRFVTALADLFGLFALLLGWHLWLQVPQPDTHQLVWLGLYAIFALAASWMVRR